MSGHVDFATGEHLVHVWIARGGRRLASGIRVTTAADHTRLLLSSTRPLSRGRYTLTERVHRGERWVLHRRRITIG